MYDVIILGGGVTGLGAAIYAARFNLKTLVISGRFGGLIQDTHIVENYPGIKKMSGLEMVNKFKEHVEDYDIIEVKEEFAKTAKKLDNSFVITTDKENEYEGKTVIIATGTRRKKLPVESVAAFENKGVSYCAVCDAPLTKDQIVAVVGGSDSAAKEALLLSEYAKKVYIIYRGEQIHPEPVNLLRVQEKIKEGKVEVINNTNVIEARGEKFLETVELDKEFNGSKSLKLQSLFIEIGHIVENDTAKQLGVELDEKGELIIDCESRTNVDGVYAAGDVANRAFKQAITGVAEGVVASFSAYQYITEGKVSAK